MHSLVERRALEPITDAAEDHIRIVGIPLDHAIPRHARRPVARDAIRSRYRHECRQNAVAPRVAIFAMMNRAHAPAPTPSVRRSLKKARVSQGCAVTRHAVTACDQAVAFVQIAEHCIEIVCRPRLYSIAAELATTLSGSPVSSEYRTIEMGTKGRFRLTLSRFHFARPVVASAQLLPTGERPRCSALSVRRRNRFGSLKLRQAFVVHCTEPFR